MSGSAGRWKRWVMAALIVVFAADVGLGVERWRMDVAAGEQQYQQTVLRLRGEVGALRTNLDKAQSIRKQMPKIGTECNSFYDDQLLSPKEGYAALVADLGDIAQKAGLKTSGLRLDQKKTAEHGVTQVDATAVIEGNYESLLRFINGLEHSKNFYVLDSLSLQQETANSGGQVKLNIHLHTYLRTI